MPEPRPSLKEMLEQIRQFPVRKVRFVNCSTAGKWRNSDDMCLDEVREKGKDEQGN